MTVPVSVIIPALNEEKSIVACLEHLDRCAGDFEIIVVDGGSADSTIKQIQNWPDVRLLELQFPQRATQMNAGAHEARGDVLLFLHADTFLPSNFVELVKETVQCKEHCGGAFRLSFGHPHWFLKLVEFVTRFNIPWFTVGDHALFFKRELFERLGGYPEIPLLEDVEFQLEARKHGKMVRMKQSVQTSPRRFLNNGVFVQAFRDVLILLSYFFGVSPTRLAAYYSNSAAAAR